MKLHILTTLLLISLVAHTANAATLPGIPEFIDEMIAQHQFKRTELESVFKRAQHLPKVIEAISRPATTKPWLEYRAAFVNQDRIKRGLKFWDEYQATLQFAEQRYGVPQEIIIAVIGVETVYGRHAGTFLALDALTTLAFDYPRRAKFFRKELENYLLLAREQELDLLAIRGSYAGALGIPQFMPSSYRNYAVDFSGDNKIDLLHETQDAIGSVANYLKGFGWVATIPLTGATATPGRLLEKPVIAALVLGDVNYPLENTSATRTVAAWADLNVVVNSRVEPNEVARLIDFTLTEGKEYWLVFKNFEVITRYNNSDFYAMTVFQLAEELKAARTASAAQ